MEPEKYGEGMAGHDGEGRDAGPERDTCGAFAVSGGGDPDGCKTLGDIQRQSGDGLRPAGGPKHVGGSDIAAARGADVLAGRNFHHQKSERDGAKKIGDDYRQQSSHSVGRAGIREVWCTFRLLKGTGKRFRPEGPEVAGGDFRQLLPQAVERDRISAARQSQVRMELSIFDGNPQRGERLPGIVRERGQLRARFDTGPENTGVAVIRKPP